MMSVHVVGTDRLQVVLPGYHLDAGGGRDDEYDSNFDDGEVVEVPQNDCAHDDDDDDESRRSGKDPRPR